MNELLKLYCDASGQRINMEKSSIYFSKRLPANVKNEVKRVMNVQNETLNEKYLGMPSNIGASKQVHLSISR